MLKLNQNIRKKNALLVLTYKMTHTHTHTLAQSVCYIKYARCPEGKVKVSLIEGLLTVNRGFLIKLFACRSLC